MGFRNDLIFKLERRLEKLSALLVIKYHPKRLAEFLRVEKDIQIQKAYQQVEGV